MNTPTIENRYCQCVRGSTRHDRNGHALVCQRCGSVKYPVTLIRQMLRAVSPARSGTPTTPTA